MKFLTTELPGVTVIEPDLYRDARGFFLETYHASRYRAGGIAATFVQDNHSRSTRGVDDHQKARELRPAGGASRLRGHGEVR